MNERKMILGIAAAGGATSQVLGESLKIILSVANVEAKFPNGFSSMLLIEEIVEGAGMAMSGALFGILIYGAMLFLSDKDYSWEDERRLLIIGAILGYAGLAVFVGPMLHELTSSADFHLFPR